VPFASGDVNRSGRTSAGSKGVEIEDRPVPWRQWSLIAAAAAGLLGVTDVVLSFGTDDQWAAWRRRWPDG
jgi:hypothetical protein